MSLHIILYQNIITPYRIPLFDKLASDPHIDFTLITFSKKEAHREQWENISSYKFRSVLLRAFSISRNYEENIYFSPSLLYFLFKEKPDVVIINGFSLSAFLTCFFKSILKLKIILWSEATKFTERQLSGFRLGLRRFISQKVDSVIDAGQLSREYLIDNFYPERQPLFLTAYNNVDNDSINLQINKFKNNKVKFENFKKTIGEKVILYIGQLIERKGIWELLESYRQVNNEMKDTALVMLGSGPLENEIKAYCEQYNLHKVILPGFIDQSEIKKYYAVCDVFVLLSHYDCNPLVIFEALAAGLPIVASYGVGNTPEFVIDDHNGYVVDYKKKEDVSNKILKILRNKQLHKKMSQNSYQLSNKSTYEKSFKVFKRAIIETVNA